MLYIPTRFRSLLTAFKQVFCKYFGYTVTATWMEDGKQFVHYCLGWNEAIDWCRQYPADCDVVISQAYSDQCIVRISK